MKFKAGDRVHVTRLSGEKVDFYGTLKETRLSALFCLIDCTYHRYETMQVCTPKTKYFGLDKEDYYTLATDEEEIVDKSSYQLLAEEIKRLKEENSTLKKENKALRVQSDNYYEMWQEELMNSEDYEDE